MLDSERSGFLWSLDTKWGSDPTWEGGFYRYGYPTTALASMHFYHRMKSFRHQLPISYCAICFHLEYMQPNLWEGIAVNINKPKIQLRLSKRLVVAICLQIED